MKSHPYLKSYCQVIAVEGGRETVLFRDPCSNRGHCTLHTLVALSSFRGFKKTEYMKTGGQSGGRECGKDGRGGNRVDLLETHYLHV